MVEADARPGATEGELRSADEVFPSAVWRHPHVHGAVVIELSDHTAWLVFHRHGWQARSRWTGDLRWMLPSADPTGDLVAVGYPAVAAA